MANKIELKQHELNDYQYEEAIKTLRTNIQFSGAGIQTVMLTSALSDEGKSDITFHLSSSLASLNKKILLIDADIRKSVFASRYHLDTKVTGLSQYLSGQKVRDEIVYETNVPNLDIIFAGAYSPNPAELLEEELFTQLVLWAREQYDYIMIDTPPMANLIDGAIISQHCDGAILVIESGSTSYKLLQKVKVQLEKGGCRILGAILNKVDMKENGYYYYGKYGRYGKYGKYGGKYGGHDAPYGSPVPVRETSDPVEPEDNTDAIEDLNKL
ncbi:MAG: CpsD/CapB family tyrosine-protein kinase [Clostridium sp.]